MNTTPGLSPEGRLIETAREDADLSIREAARRAGYSEGWWRQVIERFREGAGPLPAKTVARFAAAVDVTPEQMEAEGKRPDAARELRTLLERRASAPPRPPRTFGWTPAGAGVISSEEQAEMMPQATTILTAVIRAQDKGADPSLLTGTDLFPDQPHLALAWDTARQRDQWEVAIWTAAKGLLAWERDVAARRQGRHGSAGA